MDNIKSAREVLNKYCTGIVTFRGEDEAIKAMQEYAAQFQPKWIEGVPEHSQWIMILFGNGEINIGWHDKHNGFLVPEETQPENVIAYAEISYDAYIPDHLKAKIK